MRPGYWAAAITDFDIAILVLIPERMGLTETVYPMGLITVVAFSWRLLPVITDRKPLERKWILIPAIVVIVLLALIRILFSLTGIIKFSFVFTLIGVILIMLLAYSYYYANKSNANN